MLTTALKRENALVSRLTTVLNLDRNVGRSALYSAFSSAFSDAVGFSGLAALSFPPLGAFAFASSWKNTFAPTSAGVTVPYRRTSPLRLLRRTLRVTRTVTCSLRTKLYTTGVPTVATRNLVLIDSLGTRKEKAPVALVTIGPSTSANGARYG